MRHAARQLAKGLHLLGLAELFLQFPAFGDIAGDAEDADDLSALIAERYLGGGCPGDSSVRPSFLFFLSYHRLARTENGLFILISLPGVFLAVEIKIRLARRLPRIAKSQMTGQGRVDAGKTALAILEINRVRSVSHEVPKQIAFGSKRLLRLLARGDVLNRGHSLRGLAGGVPNHRHVHIHPDQRAILADVAFLHAVIG